MNNQEQKKHKWNQLLILLNEDLEWYKKPETEHYKQITTLGRQIFQQRNINKIDEQKYLTLVHYGYTLNQIASEFSVSEHVLFCWRKEKGYIKNKKRKMEEIK